MTKRSLSPRAERRERARSEAKVTRERERLAGLEPGGSPLRPIEVESASQVEPHALALECLHCRGPNRLAEHAAVTVEGTRLRVARMACVRCAAPRSVWFRLVPRLPS